MAFRVITANGPKTFSADEGYVLPHEHVLCDLRAWWEGDDADVIAPDEPTMDLSNADALRRWPAAVARENLVLSDWYLAAKELALAARSGCHLVVDLTNVGMTPLPRLAAHAASAAGVDIVVSVGRYLDATMSERERARGRDDLVQEWVRAVHDGIDGCAVGIIGEIGTSEAITEAERVSLAAAAAVQRETGLAVNVHLHVHARQGMNVVDALERAGADLSRVALSHCDGELDVAWLERLLARGCLIEFDLFGREDWPGAGGGFPSDWQRVDAVAKLCERGHVNQLLLSHDICLRSALKRYGGWGYGHLHERIVPLLAERIGAGAVRQITAVNPLRLLHVDG